MALFQKKTSLFGQEAELLYTDADYQVITPGSFVRCAVTGKPIPLSGLRYWSVARQEAYIDAEAAARHRAAAGRAAGRRSS